MSSPTRQETHVARLEASFRALPDKPEETAQGAVRALWHSAAGSSCSLELALERDLPELDAAGHERLSALVEERIRGVPLAYLTGCQRFMGLEMLSSADALIPRRETEILARAALALLAEVVGERNGAIVIDVCTGAGNLALAFAHHEPQCRVYGSDLSAEAVAFARKNAEHLGLTERVEFRDGDLLEPFEELAGQVDLLTCNPPYISSARVDDMPAEIADHEPRLAFDGGPFGIKILSRLLKRAPQLLKPASWLCFEVGLGQGSAMAKRLESSKHYDEVRTFEDENGDVRALAGRTR